METILDLVFWAIVGYAIGKFFGRIYMSYLEEKNQEYQDLIDKLNKIVHLVKVEKHGEVTYWFDAESDQFLAQGLTDEDIIEVLKKRFTKHIFILAEKQLLLSGPEFKAVPYNNEIK